MSSTEDDSAEKSHQPTPQKLDEARKKGDVPRSQDLNAVAAYTGLFIAVALSGVYAAQKTGTVFTAFFERADTLAPLMLSAGGAGLSLGGVGEAVAGIAPLYILPFVAVLLCVLAQRAFIFAPQKLEPKLSRLNPIQQAKNRFGLTGIFEFSKASVKVLVIAIILGIYLLAENDRIIGLVRATPSAVPTEMMRIAIGLLAQIIVVTLAIGAVDYLWQRFDHERKLMMSFREVKEEAKRSEGDPQLKAQRRERAQEIATNRMMLDVPKADVIMVNPTHYSVALKWDRQKGTAPKVTAKGVDSVAMMIREKAMEAGVPIHSDPPGTRAIYSMVEVGQEIDPDHYHAAAAAIRFADALRKKVKERGEY